MNNHTHGHPMNLVAHLLFGFQTGGAAVATAASVAPWWAPIFTALVWVLATAAVRYLEARIAGRTRVQAAADAGDTAERVAARVLAELRPADPTPPAPSPHAWSPTTYEAVKPPES